MSILKGCATQTPVNVMYIQFEAMPRNNSKQIQFGITIYIYNVLVIFCFGKKILQTDV